MDKHRSSVDHRLRTVQSDDQISKRSSLARVAENEPVSAHSLPNIYLNFESRSALSQQPRKYAELYAESYDSESDHDDAAKEEDSESPPGSLSPLEATVLGFERSAPRMPALRIGAARLSEMARPRKSNDALSMLEAQHDSAVSPHQQPFQGPEASSDKNLNSEKQPRPRHLARATIRRSQRDHTANNGDKASLLSPTKSGSQTSVNVANIVYVGEDECNGLLAPGAFDDEKQRARADGSWWNRLLYAVRSERREREAKMFRPIVVRPGHSGTRDAEADPALWSDNNDGVLSRFPFCCCAARYCVAFSFVFIIVGAIVGFFAWPRVPTLSISSLTPLAPARVIYNGQQNQYGLQMPLRITYEIHSGNFYPLHINKARVRGFDGVTGNRIIDTTLIRVPVAPLRMQFHSEATRISYLTSDVGDPALTDLFGKCAPQSAPIARATNGRPGALTIRFQITVDVGGLGWLKQPIVTLNHKVECPE
ncbi:hypothetical protein IWW40_001108 [Coemansia sp. RSA 1250]|nr:hypothetical protein IWW40_001108 [Coemansia sp. RSA 1250]